MVKLSRISRNYEIGSNYILNLLSKKMYTLNFENIPKFEFYFRKEDTW